MDTLSYAQQQRLSYIDFKLMFVGYFTRAELVEHFQMGQSNATRDIKLYKELATDNLDYDNAEKRYFQTSSFKPLFDFETENALTKLSFHLSESQQALSNLKFPFESPSQLSRPSLKHIAVLSQASFNHKAVKINYVSLSSGSSTRIIVPHSIVDNGLRWHIRAFDTKANQFRDFVIARITKVELTDLVIQDNQTKMADNQWLRIVPLELVPHPKNIQHPKAIELDFDMQKGVLKLEVKAALAGYLLRRWNVDCSEQATQISSEHQLWLRNNQTLYGVENLHLASGYQREINK